MASRTSSSVGMIVSLAIFAILTLVFFVLWVVFFAKTQRLTNEMNTAQQELAEAVASDERNDRWEELKRLAGSQGVVAYVDTNMRGLMKLMMGTDRISIPEGKTFVEAVTERVQREAGAGTTNMLLAISRRDGEIRGLTDQRDAAEAKASALATDLGSLTERFKRLEADYRTTTEALTAEIEKYKSEVDRYRGDVQTTKTFIEDELAKTRAEADSRLAELEDSNRQLNEELLITKEALRNARGETQSDRLTPASEATLVDGRVLGVSAATREIALNIGRRDRVVLGMTFEVYSSGSSIREDENGAFPPGKATIEVIRIDEGTSTGRLLREISGNPVVEGDAIVNALYDPRKVYSFAVFGNFDANGDGSATEQEVQEIRAIITQWGGRVSEDIQGDTDFLVLGSRPILPPRPKDTDPTELINRYLLLQRVVQKYDRDFETAKQTGIPVLNQNRLFTLTGLHAQK